MLTGAQSREFNYQTAGKTDQFTRYKGKDGVTLSNWVRRAAFTLKFSDFNLLLSGQINSSTKILMERDIKDRVTKLAPFLKFDGDPYPVVLGEQDGLGARRLHGDEHVPVLAVDERRERARQRLQLRAELGEGDRRRVPGHGHLLRVGPPRPDHPGVGQGVPRPLHAEVADAEPAA